MKIGRVAVAGCALGLAILALGFAQQPNAAWPSEYPSATIRESQEIVIDGIREEWRLEWAAAPKPSCESSDADSSLTGPCTGFACGEAGDLTLTRLCGGIAIEHLRLTPLFREDPHGSGEAIVQRWEPDYDNDWANSDRKDFPALVSRRQTVQVMHFADYDHDGRASEFYLQTETVPCGKSVGNVIGISRANPRLHVFGTGTSPDKPLYMQKGTWQALHDAPGRSKCRRGPARITARTRKRPCCFAGRPRVLTAASENTRVRETIVQPAN